MLQPRLIRQILHLTLLAAVGLTTFSSATAQEPWLSRLSARHNAGDGIGYNDGYTSIDWFLPLLPDGDDRMWFGDFRAVVSNDGEFTANAGSGYRWYIPEQDRIYGINAWWDSRQMDDFTFNQLGVGVETLGQNFDAEAHGFVPAVNDTSQQSLAFTGNNLMVHTVNALTGADVMAGVNLPPVFDVYTRVMGGGYYFDHTDTADAVGWRVRLDAAFRDWLAVSAVAQEDDLFGQTVTVAVELSHIIKHGSNVVSSNMRSKFRNASGGGDDDTIRHRLADPVRRQQQIVLTERDEIATDGGGIPLTFLHVVSGAAGTGTFEDPYGTITAAMGDALAPTSVVYTPRGGMFIENVNLVAGTQLLSNGPRQTVASQQGTLALPGSGVGSVLTALPASIIGDVALANNTVLSGFDVTGTLSATNVTNANIDTVRIRQPAAADAMTLTTSTGITVNNLLIDQAGARGIGIEDSSAVITQATISTTTDDAVEINNAAGNNTVSITGLTVTGAGGEGIDTNLNGAGDLDVTLSTLNIASAGNGVSAIEDVASTGQLAVAIDGTTVASTAGSGFVVDGSAGAGTTFVSQFQNNIVTAAATGGTLFSDLTFDAVPGGAIDPVSFGLLTIGASATRVTGDGASFTNITGDVDLGTVSIFNDTGTGLFVATSPALTLRSTAGTISTTNGPALDLSNTTTALNLTAVSSSNSPTRAAIFDTVDGSLAVTTTTATNAVMEPFSYTNIPLPFAVSFGNTTIDSLQGPLITNNELRVGAVGGLPAAGAIYNPLQILFP